MKRVLEHGDYPGRTAVLFRLKMRFPPPAYFSLYIRRDNPRNQSVDTSQECGFTRPGRPGQENHLPIVESKRNIFEGWGTVLGIKYADDIGSKQLIFDF